MDSSTEMLVDPIPVAIYARVSTDDQMEKATIDNQLHVCREYAAKQGYRVVDEYRDEAISGTVPLADRPAGGKLLAEARSGDPPFAKVVILRLDRLGRDTLEILKSVAQLEGCGTPPDFVDHNFDDSPTGQLMQVLLSGFSGFERALIRERTAAGRYRQVRNGKYIASIPPYGYARDQTTGELREDVEQAAVVRSIFQWAAGGMTLKSIAKRLDDEGVPPPSANFHPSRRSQIGWHFTTVRRYLTATRYIGYVMYGGKERMSCPALVDESTFQTVGEGLKSRKRRSRRNTKRTYLLQHLLVCGRCDSKYTVWTVPAKKAGQPDTQHYSCRRYRSYGAKSGHEGVKCNWTAAVLENAVKRHLLRALSDPEYLLRDAELYEESARHASNQARQRQDRLAAQINDLEREEERVLDGWQKGYYADEAQFYVRLQDVRRSLTEATARAAHPSAGASESPDMNSWKRRLLAQFATTGASVGKRGVFRDVRKDDGWVEETLARLEGRTTLMYPVFEDGMDEPEPVEIGIDEWWRDLVALLIDRITVNEDGTLTVEGTVGGEDVVLIDSSPSRR